MVLVDMYWPDPRPFKCDLIYMVSLIAFGTAAVVAMEVYGIVGILLLVAYLLLPLLGVAEWYVYE